MNNFIHASVWKEDYHHYLSIHLCLRCTTCINITSEKPSTGWSTLYRSLQLQQPRSEGFNIKWSTWLKLQHTPSKIYRILLFWISKHRHETVAQARFARRHSCQNHRVPHRLGPTLFIVFRLGLLNWHLGFSPSPRPHSYTVCPSVTEGSPRMLSSTTAAVAATFVFCSSALFIFWADLLTAGTGHAGWQAGERERKEETREERETDRERW